MLKREPQVLGELFSREPEDRAGWAGFARHTVFRSQAPVLHQPVPVNKPQVVNFVNKFN